MTTTVLAYLPSPSQGVWHLGPVPLRAYALCIIVGIVAALIIGDRRWQARGGQAGVIYDIALWAVPFGLVGGRLYHVITDWKTYFGPGGKGLGAAFQVWEGGLGIWGAVALGAVGAWIGCRSRGIPLPAFGDAIAPGIILAQAIGRLGNYFNQELYGGDTTLPWGLEIYQRLNSYGQVDYLNGVSTGEVLRVVHPTFLYEMLWNLLVFAVLLWADRKFKLGHGRLFALYVAGYCAGRFMIELMRSDPATEFAGIRVNTFTSTFVFIGAVLYIMLATKGREDPASLAGKSEADESEGSATVDVLGKEAVAAAATTGVVAAAAAAGADDDDVDDADHMHPDEVGATEDEGAEAAAAIELKAITKEPAEESAEAESADEAEAVDAEDAEEADEGTAASSADEADESDEIAEPVDVIDEALPDDAQEAAESDEEPVDAGNVEEAAVSDDEAAGPVEDVDETLAEDADDTAEPEDDEPAVADEVTDNDEPTAEDGVSEEAVESDEPESVEPVDAENVEQAADSDDEPAVADEVTDIDEPTAEAGVSEEAVESDEPESVEPVDAENVEQAADSDDEPAVADEVTDIDEPTAEAGVSEEAVESDEPESVEPVDAENVEETADSDDEPAVAAPTDEAGEGDEAAEPVEDVDEALAEDVEDTAESDDEEPAIADEAAESDDADTEAESPEPDAAEDAEPVKADEAPAAPTPTEPRGRLRRLMRRGR